MNTNLVFTWRKLYGGGAATCPAPQLVPVVVMADRPTAAPPALAVDMIEIELPRGARLRVGRGARAATLRLVLDALERR